MRRKEDSDSSDRLALIEYASPLASAEEKKALHWLSKPIRLKANRPLILTHHKYRGPWRLLRKDPLGQMEIPIRERIQGPTPTRFIICSPDLLNQIHKEKAIPPYRGKPIVLEKTRGIWVNLSLEEFSDDSSVATLSIRNEGIPLKARDMLILSGERAWPEDALTEYPSGVLINLPEGHQTTLTAEQGIAISLAGKDASHFILSFATQGRKR